MYLQDEVPHGIAIEIEEMKERKDKDLVDIRATIICEKKSQQKYSYWSKRQKKLKA